MRDSLHDIDEDIKAVQKMADESLVVAEDAQRLGMETLKYYYHHKAALRSLETQRQAFIAAN